MRWVVLLIASLVLWSQGAHAACSNPAGVTGAVVYNTTHNVPQYCDGSDNWIAMVGAEHETGPLNGLVSWWKLDETSGNSVSDAIGSNAGTYSEASVVSGTGVIDTSLDFSTNDDYIDFGSDASLDLSVGTVSVWFYTSGTAMASNRYILGKNNSGNNAGDLTLRIDGSGNGCPNQIVYSIEDGASSNNVCSDSSYTTSQWTHVVGLFGVGGMKLFVNGVEQADSDVNTVGITSATPSFVVGTASTSSTSDFDGKIDDVRIYDRRLSENEIQSLYALGGLRTQIVPSGLVGHWRLDETSGTTAADSSGNGQSGTMNGGLSGANGGEGRIDTGLNFDGTGDYITVAESATIDLEGGDFTISAWARPESFGSDRDVVSFGMADPQENTELRYDVGENNWQFNAYDTAYRYAKFSQNTPIANEWYHLVGVRDGGQLRIYVNNELGATTGTIGTINTVDNMHIGALPHDGRWWDGDIDDVRLYNRALSVSEISEIYQARDGIRYNENWKTPEYFDGNRWVSVMPDTTEVTNGLVGHWKLDEIAFSSATDSTGNGNTGTLLGDIDQTADSTVGAVGRAYSFDGVDDYVSVINNYADDFSISVWAKTTSSVGGAISCIGGNGLVYADDAGTADDFMLSISNSSKACFFTGNPDTSIFSTSDINDGAWHHIVATRTKGELSRLYVDGVFEVSGVTNGNTLNASASIAIGANTLDSHYWSGGVDDVRIYDRVLSATEIIRLFNMGAPVGQNTALPQGCPNIGDICDDGTYYGGISPDGSVEMYVADRSTQITAHWEDAGNGNYVQTSTTSTSDGDGNTNTIIIIDADNVTGGFQEHEAAQYCYDLVAHGASDWYLPAIDEIDNLKTGGVPHADMDYGGTSQWYWSSTEGTVGGGDRAGVIRFIDGTESNSVKNNTWRVRCVRKGPAPRCANPYGLEGAMVFNTTHNVVQYCDGARWIAIGKVGP